MKIHSSMRFQQRFSSEFSTSRNLRNHAKASYSFINEASSGCWMQHGSVFHHLFRSPAHFQFIPMAESIIIPILTHQVLSSSSSSIIIKSMSHKTAAVILLAAVAAILMLHIKPSQETSFEQWKVEHGKTYPSQFEEAYRKTVFLKNVAEVAAHNADSSNTYQKGINQFSDLTQDEFVAKYLTLKVKPSSVHGRTMQDSGINGDIDWVAAGKVTPVKNQAQCGSCWAFSAVAAIESGLILAGKGTYNLSEQQLVDCSRSYGNQGCNGGWMDSAFQYVRDKGLTTTDAYPYVARDQTCKIDSGAFKISGFVDVPGCDNLVNALSARPISVAVDASNWSGYKAGVFSNCGTAVNHGVLLVGATDAYWTIKNSWAASWGESGYIRLARGNTCAVCGYPSYPTW